MLSSIINIVSDDILMPLLVNNLLTEGRFITQSCFIVRDVLEKSNMRWDVGSCGLIWMHVLLLGVG